MEKEILKNQLNKKCDSCGEANACKKYNHANLCISCLRMDKMGAARDNSGKIISNSRDELILIKPDNYNERLRKTRKSRR